MVEKDKSGSDLKYDMLLSGSLPAASAAIFEHNFGVTKEDMGKILDIAGSKGSDFAELFFEYTVSNSILMEDDIIKETSENISLGVGVRVISGEKTGYGYTNDLSFTKMKQAAQTAAAIAKNGGRASINSIHEKKPVKQLYDMDRPFVNMELNKKLDLVKEAYETAQQYDSRISKVQVMFGDAIRYVTITNSEGLLVSDARPQVRLIVMALAEHDGMRNSGFYSGGGRVGLGYFQKERTPREIGLKAAEEAIILLTAVDAVPGEQTVVLGVGQSGVMIHEAVGHPLEADGNRKGTSIMSNRMGTMVATPAVTIYDDTTIPYARGSLNIDDEGTETPRNFQTASVRPGSGRIRFFIGSICIPELLSIDRFKSRREKFLQHFQYMFLHYDDRFDTGLFRVLRVLSQLWIEVRADHLCLFHGDSNSLCHVPHVEGGHRFLNEE